MGDSGWFFFCESVCSLNDISAPQKRLMIICWKLTHPFSHTIALHEEVCTVLQLLLSYWSIKTTQLTRNSPAQVSTASARRSRGCLTLRSNLLAGEVKYQLEASDLVPDLETLSDSCSHFIPVRRGTLGGVWVPHTVKDGEIKRRSCLSWRTVTVLSFLPSRCLLFF